MGSVANSCTDILFTYTNMPETAATEDTPAIDPQHERAAKAIERLHNYGQLGCGDVQHLADEAAAAVEAITSGNNPPAVCEMFRQLLCDVMGEAACATARSRMAYCNLLAIKGPVPSETIAWARGAVLTVQIVQENAKEEEIQAWLQRLEALEAQQAA
jgi:hypothetical protein